MLDRPEVAFAGRSNVGKSSLIGALLRDPKLVRTSRTPGRTQLLNLFQYESLWVVDLPGYGYAKTSKVQRQALEVMIRNYLLRREGLAGVVQVIDARRDPVSDYDRSMVAWLLEAGRWVLLALTKIDLIPKNRRLARIRAIEKQLEVPAGSSVAVSARTGEGRDALYARLVELCGSF